jgi:hypothetical protein
MESTIVRALQLDHDELSGFGYAQEVDPAPDLELCELLGDNHQVVTEHFDVAAEGLL